MRPHDEHDGISRRPTVLVITQFHEPEPCAAANRVDALSKALANAGFQVEVVTGFPSFPDGILAASDRKLVRTERHGAHVRLTRVFTYASTRISGRSRLLNWFSVATSMTVAALFCYKRIDLIIVTTPPITLALPAVAAMLRHRSRLIVDVRDVFPEVAIKMGYWRDGSFVAKLVGTVASTLYRFSTSVICVTEAARTEIIARGAGPGKVVVAPNGFDPIELAPESPYLRQPGEFVATFVGNMGLATGLDAVIDAAELLKDDIRVRFVFAGGGVDRTRLLLRISEGRLDNVTMLGVVTRAAANALIADSDVSIVPLHPGIVDSLPTKMFDALVLGCPVVCCANGEASALIDRSGGGVVVPPHDGLALALALKELVANPERLTNYATAGRAYILANYDRAKIMREVAQSLFRFVLND